jgi:hypothetical protein
VTKLSGPDVAEYNRIKHDVESEITRLFNEVAELQKDFKGQDFTDFNTREKVSKK